MIKEPQKLGEFRNKKGLEQTTDLTMGGDIRYALTSRNIDFLKGLSWGGLTVSEYREVKYRIRELENRMAKSNNMLSGKLVDMDQLFKVNTKDNSARSKTDIKI